MGYCFTRDALLMVLADGLGGHALGEVAAQQALQTLAHQFQAQARPAVRNPADFLQDSIMLAHRQIHRYAEAKRLPDIRAPRWSAAPVQNGQIHWAHAGDSRLYLMRRGQLLTRTRDHSRSRTCSSRNACCRCTSPTIRSATNCTTASARPTCR